MQKPDDFSLSCVQLRVYYGLTTHQMTQLTTAARGIRQDLYAGIRQSGWFKPYFLTKLRTITYIYFYIVGILIWESNDVTDSLSLSLLHDSNLSCVTQLCLAWLSFYRQCAPALPFDVCPNGFLSMRPNRERKLIGTARVVVCIRGLDLTGLPVWERSE